MTACQMDWSTAWLVLTFALMVNIVLAILTYRSRRDDISELKAALDRLLGLARAARGAGPPNGDRS